MSFPKVDVAIITALDKEFEAVRSKLPNAKQRVDETVTISQSEINGSIVLLAQSGERMTNSRRTATLILERYRPKYLFMTGIAAGFKQSGVQLGDIVVSTHCFYDEAGKETPEGKKPEDYMIPTASEKFKELSVNCQNIKEWVWEQGIKCVPPNKNTRPIVHHGVIATSQTVKASEKSMNELFDKHRRLRALAQEGYSVAEEAQRRGNVHFLEIRCICDFGDDNKNDDWQEYAAHAAAAYTIALIHCISQKQSTLENQEQSKSTLEKRLTWGRNIWQRVKKWGWGITSLIFCLTLGGGLWMMSSSYPPKTFRDKLEDGSWGPEMIRPSSTPQIKEFSIGVSEVTRGEFRKFVEAKKSISGKCIDNSGEETEKTWENIGEQDNTHPVVCVSWNDAQGYVNWLTGQTGKTYKLPDEDQWEYAARAGTNTAYFWGDDIKKGCQYANSRRICGNEYSFTSPVKRWKPNSFGLYDVTGNVWEWVESKTFSGCGFRGGSYSEDSDNKLTISYHGNSIDIKSNKECKPENFNLKFDYVGFRVSRRE